MVLEIIALYCFIQLLPVFIGLLVFAWDCIEGIAFVLYAIFIEMPLYFLQKELVDMDKESAKIKRTRERRLIDDDNFVDWNK